MYYLACTDPLSLPPSLPLSLTSIHRTLFRWRVSTAWRESSAICPPLYVSAKSTKHTCMSMKRIPSVLWVRLGGGFVSTLGWIPRISVSIVISLPLCFISSCLFFFSKCSFSFPLYYVCLPPRSLSHTPHLLAIPYAHTPFTPTTCHSMVSFLLNRISLNFLSLPPAATHTYLILPHFVDILMGTFTKSFSGMGGYIAASNDIIKYLKVHAGSMLHHTSMSPIVATQILTALNVIIGSDGTFIGKHKIKQLKENSNFFRSEMEKVIICLVVSCDSLHFILRIIELLPSPCHPIPLLCM